MNPTADKLWIDPGIDEIATHLYPSQGVANGVQGFDAVGVDFRRRIGKACRRFKSTISPSANNSWPRQVSLTARDSPNRSCGCAPRPIDIAVGGAIASMLNEQLGIDVEVVNQDQTLFMDKLTAKPTELPFGYVSYGMDYLDPSNMLGVWLTSGRHSWANADFDAMVKEAAAFLGTPEERIALFKEAERILIEDVPGVFVYHETPVQLIKPWLKGDALAADENRNISIHWPCYTTMSTVPGGLYVTADASTDRVG